MKNYFKLKKKNGAQYYRNNVIIALMGSLNDNRTDKR